MRHRLLLSSGHALVAMCGFVWLYSMVIAWTPDAGRSAPNSLLCGVAVFAGTFLVSQGRLWLALRREEHGYLTDLAVRSSNHSFERVVLDGSLAAANGHRDISRSRDDRAPADAGVLTVRESAVTADRTDDAPNDAR